MMMGRKTQLYAIREVFQFAMGIVLLASVVFLFYHRIIPTVREFALTLEANNINSQVAYLLSKSENLLNRSIWEGSINMTYPMPSDLSGNDYSIYFSSGKICTIVHGIAVCKCKDYGTDASLSGYFNSGGDLKLNLTKSNGLISVVMSN